MSIKTLGVNENVNQNSKSADDVLIVLIQSIPLHTYVLSRDFSDRRVMVILFITTQIARGFPKGFFIYLSKVKAIR